MIKWPITYTDYNGEPHTEDFYFNLNKAEVMQMNLEANGAYGEYLKRIVAQSDYAKIGHEFRRLILLAYGEKSADGRRFIKSKELSDSFEQTEAYSELYMQLATDEEAAIKFVSGVLPKVEESGKSDKPSLEDHMKLV